ncbi:MAG: TolC family protein [Elusimicrobia bacterium]|nr:TolC family protein [Elusimicrobiota bacterium]
MNRRHWSAFWAPALGALIFSGCAGYAPLALPSAPDAGAALSPVSPAEQSKASGLSISNSTRSLDENDVMALAVLNDPDLKAARLKAGVASAQLFSAGLLPDPRLAAGWSRGPRFTGYSVGLSEDLEAFVLRGAAKASARENLKRVDLSVLWQEQQAAASAELLFIRARQDEDLEEIISRNRKFLADQYAVDQAGFQQNASAIQKVSADLAVLADADASLRRTQLDADAARHRLDYMLGLSPQARPVLAELARPQGSARPLLAREQFEAALAALPQRRVDLLALKAGYESEQQSLRRAVLAQFPAPILGAQWGRSNEEPINTAGLSLNFPLPILNGNRGSVAVLRAGRRALRAAYQARLDQAQNEADQVYSAALIMSKQFKKLQEQTSAMKALAANAEDHFRNGTMSAGAFVGLETALLRDEEESIRLHAALESAHLNLDLLLGLFPQT